MKDCSIKDQERLVTSEYNSLNFEVYSFQKSQSIKITIYLAISLD